MKLNEKISKEFFKYALALSIIFGFFWLLGNIVYMEPTSAMRDTFIMIVGVLVAKFSTIVDNEWGSSAGSKAKDDALINAVKKPTE